MSELDVNFGALGMDLEQSLKQLKKGKLTYALNAIIEGFDGQYVNYQNEPGNEACVEFPFGYKVIGIYTIYEKNLVIYFLANPETGESEIGKSEIDGCEYTPIINGRCLNFSIEHPILSAAHRIDNCSTQIFWVDGYNRDRFLNLDNLPYEEEVVPGQCNNVLLPVIDCNKMSINPFFSIPQIVLESVDTDATLTSGAYQFAVQYSNINGEGYTSFYSVTNPISIFNVNNITLDLNSPVNKSIRVRINDLDNTGYYDYFNLAVIKTIQGVTTVDLVGTYKIVGNFEEVVYVGQRIIELSIEDVFQKFPIYETSQDLTAVNDILVRDQLVSAERINYQSIANNITLQWQTWKAGKENGYKNEIIAANYRGYMRDEVYAFEIVFLLQDGRQTDRFHIPGRPAKPYDLETVYNNDVVDCKADVCSDPSPQPRWKVYNTASPLCGFDPDATPRPQVFIGGDEIISGVPPGPPKQPWVCQLWKITTDNYNPGNDPELYRYSSKCCTTGQPFTFVAGPNSSFSVCMRSDVVEFGAGLLAEYLSPCVNTDNSFCTLETTTTAFPSQEENCLPKRPSPEDCYLGPYCYGEMAYWESEETYPCREDIWGDLAGKPIRHHKFPDCYISPIHDSSGNIYPIGIRIDLDQIKLLISNSSLTQEQKDEIVGFKIVRGNRANNKSVIAKGLIHNVGKYSKNPNANDKTGTYFYPNYPYNDVGGDPFISGEVTDISSDSFNGSSGGGQCTGWSIDNAKDATIIYTDCNGNQVTEEPKTNGEFKVCALIKPLVTDGDADIKSVSESEWPCAGTVSPIDPKDYDSLQGFLTCQSKNRFVFHSPDTHFYQPFLGNILKIETIEQGTSTGHFIQVKNHAKYKLFNSNLYAIAATAGLLVGAASGLYGTSNRPFDGIAFFTCYQTLVSIFEKSVPRKNYAYQYTSISDYSNSVPVPNNGNKQRELDLYVYLNPGVASIGDIHPINNFQRESSVYLRSIRTLPFTHEAGGIQDLSRWLPDASTCKASFNETQIKPVSSYYAAIKKCSPVQYGQIYTYDSVDTGYQIKMSDDRKFIDIFGGDIFINRFAYKSKFPYFFDNRVNAPDETDVFYNEIGNIGVPNYWFSMDSSKNGWAWNLFGLPQVNLFCQRDAWAYKKGYMFIYSYGIPYFFCESEVNVDMRQAYNTREGDFYPRVSSYIPDDWLQESYVSINFDNTYYYNKMYSKQNEENNFTFLPPDYSTDQCRTVYPFRAVFSEQSSDNPLSNFSNNWLIYKPASFFDFPQSYGRLTSLDGIEYRQVLARFENKTQIYNALLVAPTSQADVYLGQPIFSNKTPPIDLANTDMGYVGSRHKFLLKTEYGIVTVDDKRGHVFLISGKTPKNLTDVSSGVEQFFNKNLEVKLPKYIPGVPVDNPFNGVGIHGVYDAKYNRLIITKLDYEPKVQGITYNDGKFYYQGSEIQLTDSEYFCNRSFTISYDFDYQSWISFHSYLPSYYIGSSNFYLSGYQDKTWRHLTTYTFCEFYNAQAEYVLEYPYAFQFQDEILQAVQDYSKTLQYVNGDQIEVDDVYFNKVILYNNQQCSGILKLAAKPRNNLNQYMKYPIYAADSKTILYTKSDNFYKINQFWSLVKDHKQPIFNKTCKALSFDKELNQLNMNYSKMSFKKAPLRAKDLKCRFILDDRTDTRIVSQLVAVQTQKSFK